MRLGRLIFGFSFDHLSFSDVDHFSFDHFSFDHFSFPHFSFPDGDHFLLTAFDHSFSFLLTVFDRISFSDVLTARLRRSRGGGLRGFAGVAVRHGHVVGHDVGAQVTQSVSDSEGSDRAFRDLAIGDSEISDSAVSDPAISE